MGGQRHAPAALPPGKNRYLLFRRLGGPQARSGQVHKISPPPVFDPRTVQPLVSQGETVGTGNRKWETKKKKKLFFLGPQQMRRGNKV